MEADSQLSGNYVEMKTSFVSLKKKVLPSATPTDEVFSFGGSESSCLSCFISLFLGSNTTVYEEPKWLWTFPFSFLEVQALYPNIVQFVAHTEASYNSEQLTYTFVLTDGKGVRKYGHCTSFVNGEAVVALSPYPWCNFFYRLADVYRSNTQSGRDIVKALCLCGTPPSGASFLTPLDLGISFRRPYDRLCSFIDTSPLDMLMIFPDTDILFGILASLLLEKHIIIVGPNDALVSKVVMSLQALIAPFDWKHILIPIVPSRLLDVLAAPPPYLVGILTSQLPLLERVALDGVVMVLLGSNGVCEHVNYLDEVPDCLPHSGWFSALRIGLSLLKLRGPRDQTVHDLCGLFLTYYAMLFGEVALKGSRGYIKNRNSLSRQTVIFYQKLLTTQTLHLLSAEVAKDINADNIYWMDNEFIVAMIRAHPDVYPQHYDTLIGEEKQGGGYLEKYGECFGSRENFSSYRSAIHGFGGHKSSITRLVANCICGRCCQDYDDDNFYAHTATSFISSRAYFSAPSELPVILPAEEVTREVSPPAPVGSRHA